MGGAGFIEEYDAATLYRDERINRIFEGTNEINRLIVGSYTLKKAILEELPISPLFPSAIVIDLPSIYSTVFSISS